MIFTGIEQFIIDVKTLSAVLFGMVMQYFLGAKKNGKVVIAIVANTLFLALFIIPAVIELLGFNESGKVAIAIYAMSAFLSMEIVALVIRALPKLLRERLGAYLHLQEEGHDDQNPY